MTNDYLRITLHVAVESEPDLTDALCACQSAVDAIANALIAHGVEVEADNEEIESGLEVEMVEGGAA